MATEEKVFNSSPAVDEQYADIDQQERLRMGLTHSASSVGPQQEGIIMAPQPGWTECRHSRQERPEWGGHAVQVAWPQMEGYLMAPQPWVNRNANRNQQEGGWMG